MVCLSVQALLELAEVLEPVTGMLGDTDAWAMLPSVLDRGGAARRGGEQHRAFGGDTRASAFDGRRNGARNGDGPLRRAAREA